MVELAAGCGLRAGSFDAYASRPSAAVNSKERPTMGDMYVVEKNKKRGVDYMSAINLTIRKAQLRLHGVPS
jgi:hypothetical protein